MTRTHNFQESTIDFESDPSTVFFQYPHYFSILDSQRNHCFRFIDSGYPSKKVIDFPHRLA